MCNLYFLELHAMFLQKFDVVSGKQEWHCTENDTGEIDDMKNEIARYHVKNVEFENWFCVRLLVI